MYPLPDQSFLNEEVYSEKSGYQANKAQNLAEVVPHYKARRLAHWLMNCGSGKKFLDVGCSNGELLYFMKQQGFETFGVELNPRTARIGSENGLNVFNGLLEEAHFEDKSFDILYLGDVIEHVRDPRSFVKECLRVLKPGGYIIISTPNLACLWALITYVLYRIFRIPWSSVTPPHHTYQFSYQNLNLLLSQLDASVVRAWFDAPPRLTYELGSLHLLKRFKQRRTLWNGFYLIFAYSLYTVLYGLTRLCSLVLPRDFAMTVAYRKHD